MSNKQTDSGHHSSIVETAQVERWSPAARTANSYHQSLGGDVQWFAVVTRSRHERKVHDQLQSKEVEAFLPVVERWSRWRDRRKLIEWPLFPGYCFARCSSDDIRPVLACRGVVHVVSFAARPVPVPDHEIDGVRRLLHSKLPHDPCPFIEVGMWVQVVHGPLRGVRGRLVRKDQSTTLVVAIEMLGRALSIAIDAADVTAADSSLPAPLSTVPEQRPCRALA